MYLIPAFIDTCQRDQRPLGSNRRALSCLNVHINRADSVSFGEDGHVRVDQKGTMFPGLRLEVHLGWN